jgi:hypothetical protein
VDAGSAPTSGAKVFWFFFFKKELLDLPFLYRLANSLSSLQ